MTTGQTTTGQRLDDPSRSGTVQIENRNHMTDSPNDDVAAAAERKALKKAKRKAAEEARIEQARREAVAEAESRWRGEHSADYGRRTGLDLRRHPWVTALVAFGVAAVVGVVVLGVLYARSNSDLQDLRAMEQNERTAESIAGDYAVGAATFDFRDLPAWSAALKTGTAGELNSRFDVAVKTLTPLIQEVQWVQTAELIAAKTVDVRAERQFVVQVFVSTQMTSTQNPGGLNTVTPYTITLDRDDDWLITDVAGIGGVAQDGSSAPALPAPADPAPATPTPGR